MATKGPGPRDFIGPQVSSIHLQADCVVPVSSCSKSHTSIGMVSELYKVNNGIPGCPPAGNPIKSFTFVEDFRQIFTIITRDRVQPLCSCGFGGAFKRHTRTSVLIPASSLPFPFTSVVSNFRVSICSLLLRTLHVYKPRVLFHCLSAISPP